jgi:hypothetical protein
MTDILTTLRQFQGTLKNGSFPSQMTAVPLFYALLENLLMGKPATESLVSFASNYTVLPTDSVVLIDATASARTVTLPACEDVVSVTAGTTKFFVIKKTDASANAVTVEADAADTIEGSSSYSLGDPFESVILASDGNDWYVVATNGAGGGGGTDGPDNFSVTQQLFTASGSMASTTCIASVDTTLGNVDLALPTFTGARTFVVHKSSSDTNIIRLTGFSVNGSASPYTLVGSDGSLASWMVWRTSGGTWYASPGAADNAIEEPASSAQGDILYHNGTVYTRLALGTTGHVLTAGATAPEWAAAAGGGGLPEITYLRNWDAARYYGLGANPLSAQANYGLACFVYAESSEAVTRMVFGNDGGFGDGASIILNGEAITGRVTDSGANLRQLAVFSPPMVNRWMTVFLRVITVGADLRAQLYLNGSMFAETFNAGVTGTQSSGGNIILGCRGGTDQAAQYERIQGAGYVLRNVTAAQIAEWSRACVTAGQMADIPTGGSFDAAWRVGASEPGATWTPFVGAGNLTRTGTALTHGTDSTVIYR